MEKAEDILSGIGIPPEAIAFFRKYQERLGTAWHMEKNGRFTKNFRYHMLEGLKKDIPSLDLLVAGAILLSSESYLERMREEERDDPAIKHELSRIRELVLALAEYMSKHGADLCAYRLSFSKVGLRLGLSGTSFPTRRATRPPYEYLEFFCSLPAIWEEGH